MVFKMKLQERKDEFLCDRVVGVVVVIKNEITGEKRRLFTHVFGVKEWRV